MARTSTNSKDMTIAPARAVAAGDQKPGKMQSAETAASNEEHRSEHGAAADEEKQREARNGEVGEDGALELFDGRRVEPDEKGDAAGHG